MRGEVTQEQAFTRGMQPIREFMLKQTREKDLALFVRMSDIDRPQTYADIPNYVLIPAFTISELKTAFQIGFIILFLFCNRHGSFQCSHVWVCYAASHG